MELECDGVLGDVSFTDGINQHRLELPHIANRRVVRHPSEHIGVDVLHIARGELVHHLVGLHRLLAVADGASVFDVNRLCNQPDFPFLLLPGHKLVEQCIDGDAVLLDAVFEGIDEGVCREEKAPLQHLGLQGITLHPDRLDVFVGQCIAFHHLSLVVERLGVDFPVHADIAEQIIKDIKENGLYLEQITEKFKLTEYKECRGHNNLTKEELDKLYSNKLPLETALEGKDKDQVYFGDYICAMNYAVNRWSPSYIPIIIESEMPLDELNVDGVDSFVHIFNSYYDNGLVREVFGEKIEMYYEKYRAEINIFDDNEVLKFREAIINMAESDNDIVYAFYKNNRVIHGSIPSRMVDRVCSFATRKTVSDM